MLIEGLWTGNAAVAGLRKYREIFLGKNKINQNAGNSQNHAPQGQSKNKQL